MQPRPPVQCLTCGAPLSAANGARCDYCGASYGPPVAAPIVSAAPSAAAAPGYQRRMLFWYFGMVLAVSGVSALVGLGRAHRAPNPADPSARGARTTGAAAASRPGLSNPALVNVLAGDGDLLLATGESRKRRLVRFARGTGRAAWQSDPLQDEHGIAKDHVAVGADAVFVADQTQLIALGLADGSTRWRTSLTAEVPMNCAGCLALAGGRLIALQKDGSLQAFDPATGTLTWGDRLQRVPSALNIADDRVVVFRTDERGRKGGRFAVIDARDGREVLGFAPSCHSIRTFPPERPDLWSSQRLSPDGKALFVQFGNFRFCAQRWELGSGKLAWQINRPSSFGKLAEVGSDLLLFHEDHVVRRLDPNSGALATLLDDRDQRLAPLLIGAGVVVVQATPKWDSSSRKLTLWGLEPATGKRLWQFTAPEPLNGSGARRGESWDVIDAEHGIVVAHLTDDEGALVLDTLDRKTGVSLAHRALTFGGRIWRLNWSPGLVWAYTGQGIHGVDVERGQIAYHVQ